MGKQRRSRNKPHKENPTGLSSIKDFEESAEDVTAEDRDSALSRVQEELQSPNLEERLSALQTLESMSFERAQALEIVKSGITRIVGPLLVDPHTQLRACSASALRRIVENGGDEAYERMLQDDIMTSLTAMLKKYYTDWQPKPAEPGRRGHIDDEKEALIEGVTLLWSLCENNECTIKPSNEEKLVSLLLKFLDVTTYGYAISVVAAQCMLTLSEDNPSAIAELKEQEITLLSILDLKSKTEREHSEIVPLRIAAAGLLTNINNEFETETKATAIICKVTSVVAETLAIDHKEIIVELASLLPSEKSNLSRTAKIKLQAAKKILSAQQQALEILTNLCSENQDNESDSELDDSDPAEYDAECIEDDSMNDESCKITCSIPVSLLEVITSTGLIKSVIDKTLAPDKSINDELIGHSDSECIVKQIHTLRCRAFLCLNNLMAILDVDALGGVDQLFRLWMDVTSLVLKDSDQCDIELMESASSAMRAALQKCVEIRANPFNPLTHVDVELILNSKKQTNSNIEANFIRIAGSMALIFINSAERPESIKLLSTGLLNICSKETDVWIMAEVLDVIMDVFAEDETDCLAAEIKLVEKLKILEPVFKNKIRQQRKSLGDNVSVVSTVKTNLNRFIKYKGQQIANLR